MLRPRTVIDESVVATETLKSIITTTDMFFYLHKRIPKTVHIYRCVPVVFGLVHRTTVVMQTTTQIIRCGFFLELRVDTSTIDGLKQIGEACPVFVYMHYYSLCARTSDKQFSKVNQFNKKCKNQSTKKLITKDQ